jgi:hypothetical protein
MGLICVGGQFASENVTSGAGLNPMKLTNEVDQCCFVFVSEPNVMIACAGDRF